MGSRLFRQEDLPGNSLQASRAPEGDTAALRGPIEDGGGQGLGHEVGHLTRARDRFQRREGSTGLWSRSLSVFVGI